VRRDPSPLGALARGAVAGAAGTGLMTLAQTLPSKLQSNDDAGEQEQGGQAQPQDPWEQASVPAKVARRVIEGILERRVPFERIGPLTNAMHWGYGTTWGAVYGLVQGTFDVRTMRHGVAFGTAVWAMSYMQLVPMGLYEPPWAYPAKDIAMEIGYHLAYGVGTAAAFAALSRP
jgi:hypothetical protein